MQQTCQRGKLWKDVRMRSNLCCAVRNSSEPAKLWLSHCNETFSLQRPSKHLLRFHETRSHYNETVSQIFDCHMTMCLSAPKVTVTIVIKTHTTFKPSQFHVAIKFSCTSQNTTRHSHRKAAIKLYCRSLLPLQKTTLIVTLSLPFNNHITM